MKFNLGNLRLDSENGLERDSDSPEQMHTTWAEVHMPLLPGQRSKGITTWAEEQMHYCLSRRYCCLLPK